MNIPETITIHHIECKSATPLLSICIPTVKERAETFSELFSIFVDQIAEHDLIDFVELIAFEDNKEISIGRKRQLMVEYAKGKMVVMMDDDDRPADNYVQLCVEGAKKDVDCIGFLQHCTFDGINPKMARLSLQSREWGEKVDGYDYVRSPYQKTPILKSKILEAGGYLDMRWGEDHDFSKRVTPLLHTEHYIDQVLYFYRYSSKEQHNKKYGLDKQ